MAKCTFVWLNKKLRRQTSFLVLKLQFSARSKYYVLELGKNLNNRAFSRRLFPDNITLREKKSQMDL